MSSNLTPAARRGEPPSWFPGRPCAGWRRGRSGRSGTRRRSRRLSVAKSCSSGYTHAVIGEKCLRAGEFCAHRYDWQYRRYCHRCIRDDARVGRYRLTRR